MDPRGIEPLPTPCHGVVLPVYYGPVVVCVASRLRDIHTSKPFILQVGNSCGPDRSRTGDLRNANAALYQLSYRPVVLNNSVRIIPKKLLVCAGLKYVAFATKKA